MYFYSYSYGGNINDNVDIINFNSISFAQSNIICIFVYNKKGNKMKLYRSILLNEGEEINTGNIGNSWTLCDIFAERHAEDINNFHEKDGFIVISTEVSEEDIDFDNTLFAMENRDSEYEVVINGLDIEFEVELVEGLEHIEEGETFNGNTGDNDFEDYCTEYEGELTKEDFLILASEF